jgi:hypothetical protein
VDAVTAKRQRKMSQRQERHVAEALGGRTVSNSGAEKHSGGGDVRLRSDLRAECKTTEKTYYVLKHADLVKIRKQAIFGGMETPIFHIRFSPPRAIVQEFVITPGSGAPFLSTDRKRMKLELDGITLALLSNPDGVTLDFDGDKWVLCSWSTYLAKREASAGNSHDR